MVDTIDQNDDQEVINYIERVVRAQVVKIIDEKGFSLLHYAVLKSRPEKVKLMIEYARNSQKESEDNIRVWVNQKTSKDKFTALHFASFKGNIDII